MSDSLWPHGLQHARLPSPSPTPRACSISCPSSQWCHPPSYALLSLLLLSSVFSGIRVFSSESFVPIRWPKYWSFSFSISPSNEYSGLISIGIDWWISLRSKDSQESSPTPQYKSINSLALSFIVQFSHPYMTTGKTITLTRWAFVGKVMSLLFNTLSRLIIAFLQVAGVLISWLQSPSAVILELPKINCRCFYCFPFCLPWSDGTGCCDLRFLNAEF